MITYDLIRDLEEIEKVLDAPVLKELINLSHQYLDEGISSISAAAIASSNFEPAVKKFRDSILAIRRAVKDIGTGRAFKALERIEFQLGKSRVFARSQAGLLSATNEFYDAYEDYVGEYDFETTFRLLTSAERFAGVIESARTVIAAVKDSLLVELTVPERNETINLFFAAPISHKDFVDKVSAIQNLYEEACRLMDVSMSEFPLGIRRIEAGSVWLNLFGESRVISFITSAIESAISYLHRNFTREGKIQEIPKNVETIVGLLDLSKKLNEVGVDNTELNKSLGESALKLGNELNRLLRGEPTIDINGRRHSVGREMEQRFLKENRMLFLTNGVGDHEDEEQTSSE
jgi:hypothetical protein